MSGLHDDLIHDILLRLQVKDLLRYRCLSKSLCTLIDSPAFIAAHLNQSRHRRKVVFFGPVSGYTYNGYNAIDLDDDDEIHGVTKLNNPLEPTHVNNYIIVGSCNGLLLLHNESGSVLWNPFTRESRRVPLCHDHYCKYPRYAIGLGHDSATNDYKIVTIGSMASPNQHIEVWVFDLASDTWSEVVETPFRNQYYRYSRRKIGVFANGALHWLLGRNICSFNISTQVFVKILPQIPPGKASLQVLEGRVILVLVGKETLSLYRAADFEWNLLCKINLIELYPMIGRTFEHSPFLHVKVLAYSKDKNKILLQYPDIFYFLDLFDHLVFERYLFWYDIQRGTFKPIHLPGNGGRALPSQCNPHLCCQSLVSVNRQRGMGVSKSSILPQKREKNWLSRLINYLCLSSSTHTIEEG